MPASARATANLGDPALRSRRKLLLVAGLVYFVWWFVVEAVLPGSYNPLRPRLVVVASFLLALGASYRSAWVRRHIEGAFLVSAWLLTAHYAYLLHRNHGDLPWAVGTYVVVIAVGACLPTRRSLLAYSVFSVLLGVAVALVDRALLATIFLPGLVTMTLLSNITLHSRVLLERERTDRVRAEAARALAEAGVAARDEFIAIASHELFTPLAALQLAVQGLTRSVRRDGVPSAESLEASLETCQRQTARLTRLAQALLDASRISAGALALRVETVSLLELVREVAQVLAPDAERAGSTVEIEGDDSVAGRWDRAQIEQVVSNLLRNAIAFGLGRPIRLTVAGNGEGARFTIADHGMGVAREHQERIFARFERAVSARNYGGMGLGLYVVRQIVEAHGGAVRVESEAGSGATFTVDLPPVSGPETEAERAGADSRPPAAERREDVGQGRAR